MQNSDELAENEAGSDGNDDIESEDDDSDDDEDVSDCHSDGIEDDESEGNHECSWVDTTNRAADPSNRNLLTKHIADAQIQIQAVSSTQQNPSSSVERNSTSENGNNANRRNVNGDQLA